MSSASVSRPWPCAAPGTEIATPCHTARDCASLVCGAKSVVGCGASPQQETAHKVAYFESAGLWLRRSRFLSRSRLRERRSLLRSLSRSRSRLFRSLAPRPRSRGLRERLRERLLYRPRLGLCRPIAPLCRPPDGTAFPLRSRHRSTGALLTAAATRRLAVHEPLTSRPESSSAGTSPPRRPPQSRGMPREEQGAAGAKAEESGDTVGSAA